MLALQMSESHFRLVVLSNAEGNLGNLSEQCQAPVHGQLEDNILEVVSDLGSVEACEAECAGVTDCRYYTYYFEG